MSVTGAKLLSIRLRSRESEELINATPDLDEFTVLVMLAGDWYRQGLSKAVRIGVTLLTTTGLIISLRTTGQISAYTPATKVTTQVSPTLHRSRSGKILQLNAIGYIQGSAASETYAVKLLLGGDLPWILAVLGKRAVNLKTSFSPYCLCPREEMYDFDLTEAEHIIITADLAAQLTHTLPEAAYHNQEHIDFECPVEGAALGEPTVGGWIHQSRRTSSASNLNIWLALASTGIRWHLC
eukprot:4186510-Pleurochrysis_carterae.AAC.3